MLTCTNQEAEDDDPAHGWHLHSARVRLESRPMDKTNESSACRMTDGWDGSDGSWTESCQFAKTNQIEFLKGI